MREATRKYFIDRYKFLLPTVSFECGDAWFPLVKALLDGFQALIEKRGDNIEIEYIGQKYGTLRVYHAGGDEYEELVDQAEELSKTTCEVCGSRSGKMRDDHDWLAVLCDECAEARLM